MAQNTRLPPQAYTRDTVVHAFNWLQSQSDQVRDMVQTTDDLVSLYLRAQRFGENTTDTEAPVSSRNFKEDLKNLAQGLKHFEIDPTSSRPIDPVESPIRDRRSSPVVAAGTAAAEAMTTGQQQTQAAQASQKPVNHPSLENVLGEQGMKNLRTVMSAFNLTSEPEALRMIVATGTRKLLHFLDN